MIRRIPAMIGIGVATLLAGCGSVGITGGSVPVVKFRGVTGVALLPGNRPVVTGSVVVRTLSTRSTLQTGATDGTGTFRIADISTTADIEIVVTDVSGAILRIIVGKSALQSGGAKPFSAGNVTATTTVAAAAIELEVPGGAQNGAAIVASQFAQLTQQAQNLNHDETEQERDVTDSAALQTSALTTAVASINEQLRSGAASDALNGIVGYLQALQQAEVTVADTVIQRLAAAQSNGTRLSAQNLAAELVSAGAGYATAANVQQSSTGVRAVFTQLPTANTSISPFEALFIAGLPKSRGGFELKPSQLAGFAAGLAGG